MDTLTHEGTAQIPTAKRALTFILAGNATFTLVSQKTGTRFTYNVRRVCCEKCKRDYSGRKINSCRECLCHKGESPARYFVSLLTGPDNESNYSYMGMLVPDNERYPLTYKLITTRNAKVGQEAPSYVAFNWVFDRLRRDKDPENIEIWHAGKCCMCGRKLTVPQSIEMGIGPECLGRL